jgi:hypothetical protein
METPRSPCIRSRLLSASSPACSLVASALWGGGVHFFAWIGSPCLRPCVHNHPIHRSWCATARAWPAASCRAHGWSCYPAAPAPPPGLRRPAGSSAGGVTPTGSGGASPATTCCRRPRRWVAHRAHRGFPHASRELARQPASRTKQPHRLGWGGLVPHMEPRGLNIEAKTVEHARRVPAGTYRREPMGHGEQGGRPAQLTQRAPPN